MGKFILLSRYHFRKNKGQYFSFSVIVLIAAMLFGLGLITMRNVGKMYEDKFEQYNCADVFYTLYDNDWKDAYYDEVKEIDGVLDAETRTNIMLSGEASYKEAGNTLGHIFFNMEEQHKMNKIETIGETLDFAVLENPIYISYWMKTNGCNIGDTYQFVSGNQTYYFTIAGFVEDLMYGNNNCGNIAVYLPDKAFRTMYGEVSENAHAKTLSLQIADREEGKKVFTKLGKILTGNLTKSYTYTYGYFEMCKRNRTVTGEILATMLVAFSLLLVIITIFVINFRIKSSMEEELQNMGVLTSMGYTTRQVIWSVVIPYLILGLLCVLLGLIGSNLFLPVIQNIFAKLSGLLWKKPFDISSMAIVLTVIMCLILFTALFSARKIRRLHPIEALRSGIKHHSFKRNYFPLEKTRANLHIVFALKGFINSMKQSIFLFVILTVMTFTTVYMTSGLYNSTLKSDKFINVISEENPTVLLTTYNHQQSEEIKSDLYKDDRVREVLYYDTQNVLIGEDTVGTFVIDEYEKLTNDICYAGRTPKHDNEIVIGSYVADSLGVNVGDQVKVKYGLKSLEYLIVGLIQSPNYNGAACEMTSEGFKRLSEEFEQTTLYIYLKDSKESGTYTDEIAKKYKDKLVSYCDQQSMIDEVFDNFIPIMVMVVGIISIVVVALVIVVLYMIIKTMISHRKQELGISKALGYTTKQLSLQLSYSLFPALSLGSILGGILGYFFLNKLWLLCFYGVGIRKVTLTVPVLWAIFVVVIMILFSTIVSVVMARRIKHISPIKLIRE